MGVASATWLVDTSALARLDRPEVVLTLGPRIDAGLVGITIVTELELGYSARSAGDYDATRETVASRLIPITLSLRAEDRARAVQQELVRRGHHRSAGVADLLVAAAAEIERMTVLHYDADFDLIAEITGQPCEWIVPRGTI